jgi:hypothetical protein
MSVIRNKCFLASDISNGTLPGLNIAMYEQFIKFMQVEISAGENLFCVKKGN